MTNSEAEKIIAQLEAVLLELHSYQVARATSVARLKRPELTSEDLLNPDDYLEIISDPHYMHEDGQAAGILSAKIAVRTELIKVLEKLIA